MNHKKAYLLVTALLVWCCASVAHAADLNRVITISSNEKFELLHGENITFKFKPLSDQARVLEITKNASSLGVAYLGQLQLRETTTALAALRTIADQIGKSLDLSFGVIADSNTSEALKANTLLLLYHPDVTLTLILAKPIEQDHYEIICTYVLREIKPRRPDNPENPESTQVSTSAAAVPPAPVPDENKPD